MLLTKDEEDVLNGGSGEVVARAMRLLVTLGEIEEASRLVPINRSQVAGVSYKTAGDATLELVESIALSGATARTQAMQNPAGMDLLRWRDMGVSEAFAAKQKRICQAYENIGIKSTCTCTPYLCGNKPDYGEIIGFSESSAVAYSNSVLGARSNRQGGLDALAAALVGKVPLTGYLLDENRLGDIEVRVECELTSEADYGALGYFVGKHVSMDEVPVYPKMNVTKDRLKLMGAASAASGSVALYHVKDTTREATRLRELFKNGKPRETLVFDEQSRRGIYDELSSSRKCNLVALGCPHCSIHEMREIAELIAGKQVNKKTRLWVFTSPTIYEKAKRSGYLKTIRASGGDVFRHTCMVVAPLEEMGVTGVATNSAKAAFYVPRMTKNSCSTSLSSLHDCVSLATS
ncbi:aconitase X catalytic domain-containing protein [Candidatus Bathyarchaeota archaeon]|nr:aconitase X catalytic domain-containing protein [Candidatus Bathyarchaeota archaeon]